MSDNELHSLARELEAHQDAAANEARRLQASALEAVSRIDPKLSTRLVTLFGTKEKAAAWLCRRRRALGASPLKLLGEGRRDTVLKVIVAIEHGDVI